MSIKLLEGDNIAMLKTLEPDSIDSVVTDPPYGLSFMGKKWDHDVPSVEFWEEVYRVLKPGGHVLSFSGTRTYHRMVVAIEDAGFEIRDQIGWLFGTGFPKSLDVSKAIDKAGGLSPKDQAVLLRERREAAGLTREQVAERVGCTVSSVRDWEEGRARGVGRPLEHMVPSADYRSALADILGYTTDERRAIGISTDRRDDGTVYDLGMSGTLRTGGHTDLARKWQGWGTALKPAWEPCVVARKPLIGTVAENVLAHDTGALNIDACRVATNGEKIAPRGSMDAQTDIHEGWSRPWQADKTKSDARLAKAIEKAETIGRWPANVIHDGSDEVEEAFAAFGEKKSNPGKYKKDAASGSNVEYAPRRTKGTVTSLGYSGSASRFFYCAKASKKDRAGSKHPTVKPIALMSYLVRLVTPPGGIVLDPFAGSGTTGQAALDEGFKAVLIEREPEYIEDIKNRFVMFLEE